MIFSKLSSELTDFLAEIEALGFQFCLVGGAVRDFILNDKLGDDLDFEIRSKANISDTEWEMEFTKIHNFLNLKKVKFEKLPYLIIRLHFSDHSLEFSSPRIENYLDKNNKSHHNFIAQLSSNYNYHEAFKRRDFTFNAIGMELSFKEKTFTWVDPYNGIEDLKNKTLNLIDENFYLDPVRFLRLIRFSIKFNFKIANQIENNISRFDLSQISDFHFCREMYKCSPFLFLSSFQQLIKDHKMQLPIRYNCWMLTNVSLMEQFKISSNLDWLFFVGITQKENLNLYSDFFVSNKKDIEDILESINAYNRLSHLTGHDKRELINLSLSDLAKHDCFLAFKKIFSSNKWAVRIREHFNHPQFLMNIKDINVESVPNELRTAFKFQQILNKWIDDV